jgi:hypothetical protein
MLETTSEKMIETYGAFAFMAIVFMVAIIYLFRENKAARIASEAERAKLVERLVAAGDQNRVLLERVLTVLESLTSKIDRRS